MPTRQRRGGGGITQSSSSPSGEGVRVAEELTERAEEAVEQLEECFLNIPHGVPKKAEKAPAGAATVNYFAYGSNLSSKVLTGRRNVHPVESMPAVVPGFKLVFHQPGLPYTEPGFASVEPCSSCNGDGRGNATLAARPDVHGVLYRLVPDDFKYVLMTEGAGNTKIPAIDGSSNGTEQEEEVEPEGGGYTVLVVDVELYDGSKKKAYTLTTTRTTLARLRGRDALPSKRYLTIIREGAAESGLKQEYQDWLATVDHYEHRTLGQKIGRIMFAGISFLILSPAFVALRLHRKWYGVENGGPKFLMATAGYVFRTVWTVHEVVRPVLGCGATNVAK